MGLAQILQWNVTLFLLILSRWAGMIVLAPVFGARGVPMMVKLGLAVSVSVVIFPVIQATEPTIPTGLIPYIGIVMKEIIVGLVIGFLVYMMISAVIEGAGQIIDFQMGFMMGASVDPIYGTQSPMMANFHIIVATMLLLATNAHHFLIAAVVRSYSYIPINPGSLPQGIDFYIALIRDVFSLSIQLSLPVLGAIFLAEVGVGLLAKTVPQLNIFAVIFPVKIIFGFVLIILAIPFFGDSVSMLFDKSMAWLLELFKGWQQ